MGDIKAALMRESNPIILGGGSNIVFTGDTEREALVIDNKGIQVEQEGEKQIIVSIAAGEIWHDVVIWSIRQGYGGIENLSLIPGKCGAAPIQNIGAYGVELSDVLIDVSCLDKSSLQVHQFSKSECVLGYRDSKFKNDWKDQFVITSIRLALTKAPFHRLNSSYGAIAQMLMNHGVSNPEPKDISKAVIEIRRSKLPDPECLPNAGSFFKNPIIPITQFRRLVEVHGKLPSYPVSEHECKVPAGWLIDQCGWKGIMIGDVGVHTHQALVLVNHGAKNGNSILSLAQQIQSSVKRRFDIQLQPEVNILP